jgi:hypothetical protein
MLVGVHQKQEDREMDLRESRRVVFTAQSKAYFYCRDAVCKFVLDRGMVPIHPFQAFGYFLNDIVDRDLVRRGNFNFVRVADELWVFGDKIANGVGAEIIYAHELQKQIRFFSIAARAEEIVEIGSRELVLESPEEYTQVQRAELLTIIGR